MDFQNELSLKGSADDLKENKPDIDFEEDRITEMKEHVELKKSELLDSSEDEGPEEIKTVVSYENVVEKEVQENRVTKKHRKRKRKGEVMWLKREKLRQEERERRGDVEENKEPEVEWQCNCRARKFVESQRGRGRGRGR